MSDGSLSLWRNRLARSAVNRKVGGSSPPRDEHFYIGPLKKSQNRKPLFRNPHDKELDPLTQQNIIVFTQNPATSAGREHVFELPVRGCHL